MATVRKATHVANLNTTEDDATAEIFGGNIKKEKEKAINALNDFAIEYPNIKRDRKILVSQIECCTRKGQAAEVMAKIRRTYM